VIGEVWYMECERESCDLKATIKWVNSSKYLDIIIKKDYYGTSALIASEKLRSFCHSNGEGQQRSCRRR
jgi:hypothetical protein